MSELLEVVHGHIVVQEMEHDVLKSTSVSVGENETITVDLESDEVEKESEEREGKGQSLILVFLNFQIENKNGKINQRESRKTHPVWALWVTSHETEGRKKGGQGLGR